MRVTRSVVKDRPGRPVAAPCAISGCAYGELDKVYDAIRAHRDQRGDDRCWQDDETLYKVLPEGYTAPARDTAVEIRNCERYIACRQNPGTSYVSPTALLKRYLDNHCQAADQEGMSTLCECKLCLDTRAALFAPTSG